MVSIIERNSYVSELRKNEKFNLFFSFLFFVEDSKELEINAEVDDVFQSVLVAFIKNDKSKFNEFYDKIAEREPNKHSPFTNDDLLLFVLIVGALKFKKELNWVKNVLDVRESSSEEGHLIKKTFQNIINGNFRSKDNAFHIIIVMEELLELELLSWNEKKFFYQDIVTKSFPFYKSELLNISALKAYDLIVLEGDKSNEGHFQFLKEFERKFSRRTKLFSLTLFYSVCILFSILITWLAFSSQFGEIMGKFETIFGIIGIAIFSFFKRNSVINWIDGVIKKFLGYPEKRIENE